MATDASSVGLGAVLFKGSHEDPRYVECGSASSVGLHAVWGDFFEGGSTVRRMPDWLSAVPIPLGGGGGYRPGSVIRMGSGFPHLFSI